AGMRQARGGRERYWLTMTLIGVNVLGVTIALARAADWIADADADALLMVLGLSFAYLATTTLFRVYPAPVQLNDGPRLKRPALTPAEQEIADKVRNMMELDKVYHEPTFSRADLAREIGISEGVLSRVINSAFGKSFPRLLNEL